MDFEQLMRSMGGGAAVQPGQDVPTVDTSEMGYISSLALLKVPFGSIFLPIISYAYFSVDVETR